MSRRKRRRASNKKGVFSISFIVGILLISLTFQSNGLKEKLEAYAAQQESLQQQIDRESERAEEIKRMEEYKLTREYVEGVARNKLGLVYTDEIVFKPSNP